MVIRLIAESGQDKDAVREGVVVEFCIYEDYNIAIL